MWWQLASTPSGPDAPQVNVIGTMRIPAICIDEATGNIYIGGVNKSATWSPSGNGTFKLEQPQPTADPRVFTLSKVPLLLLLFMGGELQLSGIGNDFLLSGNQITMANAPGPGSNLQAVVG